MTIAWYYNDKTKRCIASANTVIQCVTVPCGWQKHYPRTGTAAYFGDIHFPFRVRFRFRLGAEFSVYYTGDRGLNTITSAHDYLDSCTPFQFCAKGFLLTKSVLNGSTSHFESLAETQETFDFCLGGNVNW